MIVYKIKDNKIASVSPKDENYILKVDERSSDIEYSYAFYDIGLDDVIEKASQIEIDAQAVLQAKQDLIQSFIQNKSTFGVAETSEGRVFALVLGDDGKAKEIEIK